jgi:hypothetical protein
MQKKVLGEDPMFSWRKKAGLAAFLCLATVLLSASFSQGGVITENFANNQYNEDLWWIDGMGAGVTATVANNRLELTLPASTGGNLYMGMMNSEFSLGGDFDVQADFSLLNWPANNGAQLGLTIDQANDFSIFRRSRGVNEGGGGEIYFTMIKGQMTQVATSGTGGKLRITKVGNTMSGYYWDGTAWQLVGTGTDPSFSAITHIGLNLNRDVSFSGPSVSAAFDNVQVTYNKYLISSIYEGFENNSYDQDFWFLSTQGTGPTTAVANDLLKITIPANSNSGENPYPFGGQIGSKFELVGDFDVQVDYSLLDWPSPTGIQVGIGPRVYTGMFPAGVWLMNDPTYDPVQVYEAWLNGDDFRTAAPGTSGKLRLQRLGNTISTYYYDNGWQFLGSRTDTHFGPKCGLNLYVYSHNFQNKAVKVIFDNIIVTYNRILRGKNNPTPAILQLLLH